MTILIADDDKSLRFFLKSMLLEILEEDSTIILEASDGAEFINCVAVNNPDIAFVDIRMPIQNGLNAIEIAKTINKNTIYTILSGYTEFEYAKKSIALGVLDYLIKPIDKIAITNVLKKAENEMGRAKLTNNSMLQSDVLSILNFKGEMPVKNTLFYKPKNFYYAFCFYVITKQQDAKVLQETNKNLIMSFRDFFVTNHFNYESYCTFFSEGGNLLMIINCEDSFITTFSNYFTNLCTPSFKLVAGYKRRKNLIDAVNDTKEMDNNRGFAFDKKNLSSCEYIDVDEKLSNLVALLEGSETSNDIAINTLDFSNIYLQESLNMYFGKPINSFEEVKKCLKTIASKDTEVISIEEEAIKFMEKNYMNNINVKDIADKLGITPNYLSSLFHNKMGIKLVDYLLQIRMERAMYLLKNNQNATIKNIAIMVGISNTRYFSNLFKAHYGVLPSQVKG